MSNVSKAVVLEEMFKLPGMLRLSLQTSNKELTHAEVNIILRKVNPLYTRAFPVTEEASEDEINRWIKHPQINCLMPDSIMIDMASHTPIPTKTMERMLKKLLGESYQKYWKMAHEQIKYRNE